jgi:adenylosuccinate lyase
MSGKKKNGLPKNSEFLRELTPTRKRGEMLGKYILPEMEGIWDKENKYNKWLQIEIAVCEALQKQGVISKSKLDQIKKKAVFDPEWSEKISRAPNEMLMFLSLLEQAVGEDNFRFVHLGLTSSDITDTTLSLQLKESGELIVAGLIELKETVKRLALKYKYTPTIGRTHGIHAEPTTFGLKLASWYSELCRQETRLKDAIENIRYGKIAGSVGNFAQLEMSVEKYVCEKFDLNPEPVSTQVIPRDRHAQFVLTLALLGSSLERFATEIRNLQRTEILEVEEPFRPEESGSSSMPHKRNPVSSERICGLARILRSNCSIFLENNVLWNERDATGLPSEETLFPLVCGIAHYMVVSFNNILENLIVYPKRMEANIYSSKGIVFSQRLLLHLIEAGLPRKQAYDLIQGKIMTTWQKDVDLHSLVVKDGEIRRYLTLDEIENLFQLDVYMRSVDDIFQRVFGEEE